MNEEKIEAHKWMQLNDGDRIRCGKVSFDVSIKQASPVIAGKNVASTAPSASPDAWQETDIAQFLEAEDEADRDRRYHEIRATFEPDQQQSSSSNLDIYPDTPLEEDDPTPVESTRKGESPSKRTPSKSDGKQKTPRIPKQKARGPKKLRAPRFSVSLNDTEHLKMVGAALLAIALIGFLGFQIYQFGSAPTIQVLQDID